MAAGIFNFDFSMWICKVNIELLALIHRLLSFGRSGLLVPAGGEEAADESNENDRDDDAGDGTNRKAF